MKMQFENYILFVNIFIMEFHHFIKKKKTNIKILIKFLNVQAIMLRLTKQKEEKNKLQRKTKFNEYENESNVKTNNRNNSDFLQQQEQQQQQI